MAKLGAKPAWTSYAESITAARTLTAADSGKMFFVDSSSGALAITLPAVSGTAALHFEFISTDSTADVTIVCDGTEQKTAGVVYTCPDNANPQIDVDAAATTVTIVTAALPGTFVELHSNGSLWYVQGFADDTDLLTLTG